MQKSPDDAGLLTICGAECRILFGSDPLEGTVVAETDFNRHRPIGRITIQSKVFDWHRVAPCAGTVAAQEIQHVARLASQTRQFEPWHFKCGGLIIDFLDASA